MRAEDSHIMNILYSPIMYIHSERLLALSHSTEMLNDVMLNHWIIRQYQLDDLPDNWQPEDPVSPLIFNHWALMPRVALLVGGYLLRENLLIEKSQLMSDATLLKFISLPLRHCIAINRKEITSGISAMGAAFLLGITSNLPSAIGQRLRLCFPPDIQLPSVHISKTPDHINLLKMAINYANDS